MEVALFRLPFQQKSQRIYNSSMTGGFVLYAGKLCSIISAWRANQLGFDNFYSTETRSPRWI